MPLRQHAAVASPAAADTVAQEADQEDQEGSREGAGGEQRSGGPETPEERDLRRARDTLGHIETVRQEVAKYQRRAHLQYYHPRCERLADGTPAYPPSQAAVNRDRTAAACLPLAGALIEELLLRLEEKNAAIRMAEADAEIADVRHEGAMIALTAEVMARRGSTSEYAPAAAASETQLQRAEWLKRAMIGLPTDYTGPRVAQMGGRGMYSMCAGVLQRVLYTSCDLI